MWSKFQKIWVCIPPTTFKKPTISSKVFAFLKLCRQNTTASTETFTEKQLGLNFAFHFTFYLSITLSKTLPPFKNNKKHQEMVGIW